MTETGAVFHPIISSIQKIALYETKSKFYLVGSNNTQTRFRVIKIDRMDPKELFLVDDKVEYTPEEINDLITMIYAGNRQRSGLGVSKVISAFGIVGFIRFLEGYYIILITKRRKVAVVGLHTIYKIEDTSMIYIPHESCRVVHPEEPRYVKMFQNIDLASNFYFSYSYDITHSLQHNMTHPRRFLPNTLAKQNEFSLPEYISMKNLTTGSDRSKNYGIRTAPHRKFVWNSHLLSLVEAELHPDWLLYVVHGFIGQSNISIYGRAVYVTLIARRSSKYAGTRFLKRGANFNGDVANEVETEQMVHDSCVSSLSQSHFTSFLQMRGSIPGHWKQEMGKMVGKPAITMDLCDPFAETAGLHFNELLKRYGAPIIVLNLVKKREKKQQESLLSDLLSNAVIYLNQFLAPDHQIVYKTFDMARKSKGSSNVLRQLGDIAKTGVMKTGFFHNQRKYFSQRENTIVGQNRNNEGIGESLQTGIIRTNCVDCLDRTNTAQFAIGKCVLGYQLCALGILDTPDLEFDTDCVRMLELLYEDHGDTLALQYGGSQLVHRIKTYRKTAPWTSQGNDIMQTLSRYYSNTFSDAEKQNTINLFLGTFVPNEGGPQIWDYSTDYYFHHKPRIVGHKSLTQWWDKPVLNCLPFAYNDLTQTCFEIIEIHSRGAEMTDAYIDYHRPFELSVLSEVYSSKISNSIRDFMPDNTTDYSPFSLRIRPVKRRDGTSVSKAGSSMKNPSVTGQSSSNSTTSSSSDESSCDDEDSTNEQHTTSSSKELTPEPVTFKSLFPPMKDVYGTELKKPSKSDILVYKKYVLIGKKSSGTASKSFTPISVNLKPFCADVKNSSRSIEPPVVDQKSVDIYKKYVELGKSGDVKLNRNDLVMYQKYAFFV